MPTENKISSTDKKSHPVIPLLNRATTGVRVIQPYLYNTALKTIDFDLLRTARKQFDYKKMPFMQKLLERMKVEKPYQGLKILSNTHLTWSTIAKLEPLLVSGAHVTATVTKTLKCNPEVVELMRRANVEFIDEELLTDDYDLCLDCCADLSGKIAPRIGVSEQTQTGSVIYKAQDNRDFGVISVDECRTKKLETYYGTGDGFVRAIRKYVETPLNKLKFCVFGYGKVGRGIVNTLSHHADCIYVVEQEPECWVDVTDEPVRMMINRDDKEMIAEVIRRADVIVTATGVKNTISDHYDANLFDGKILANMGSEDEFGYKFSDESVLAKKMPINFTLSEPTLAKYLDPIFYIHNVALDVLINKRDDVGMIDVPKSLDEEILKEWCFYHNESYDKVKDL